MSSIVLIGAGSHQFGFDTMGDIFLTETLAGSRIILHDINAESLNHVLKKGKEYVEVHNLPFTVEATTDRKKALAGADFVIISIEVGNRFKLWEEDRTLPQQYGINQVYGENGGPGGVFHALRITRPILEICDDVANICPEAYVFNYSNPMVKICTTVHRKYPKMRFIGLCHEIVSLERHLPKILDIPWEEIETTAGGLNHFSFLLDIHHRKDGSDLYPAVRQKAPAYFRDAPGYSDYLYHYRKTGIFAHAEGSASGTAKDVEKVSGEWADRALFRYLFEEYGYLPITVDSHQGEYLGWAHDVADHKGIIEFLEWYAIELSEAKGEIQDFRKERVASIMSALLGDGNITEGAVNIPNKGFIDGLPEYLVVEVPAVISPDGIGGIPLKDYPQSLLGLLQNQVAVNNLVAEAVLTESKECAIHALLADPVTNNCREIREMAEVFFARQSEYLGYLR